MLIVGIEQASVASGPPHPAQIISIWILALVFFAPWLGIRLIFESPKPERAADNTLVRRTALAVAAASVLWVLVATTDYTPTGANPPQQLSVGDIAGLVFLLAIPAWYALFVVWMVGGDLAERGHPLGVALFFVASVAVHIGAFAFIYLNIYEADPESFSTPLSGPSDVFYLATTTFTTVGSGSLAPMSGVARVAVATESLLSVVMVVVGVTLVLRRLTASVDEKEP